ncbi:MAG TPA: type VI secretion system accessory protein TagJ [Stellaceae bacterium]|nr:type VI secretion system accessory protein TagJ [Stellaceae bacterium]
MGTEDWLRGGDPSTALSELQEQIRKNPSNAKLRVFLFQLLAIEGRWDRALTQLNVAGELDAGNLAMVQTYRDALACEALREQIFAGNRSPLIFGQPATWIALLVEALRLAATGEVERSQQVRDEAFAAAPVTKGVVDGQPFEWIADADARLGPMLETIINGRYYWVPFNRIREIRIEKPADLRDVVWMPAYFTWANGGESVGLIPTRYPGSQASSDPQLRLARRTDWSDCGSELFAGLGQRMLATDVGEYPIMDARAIRLDTEATDAELDLAQSAVSA